jgi:hypothetical protein
MRCIFNAASDVQNILYKDAGLKLSVIYYPGMLTDNSSAVLPFWTVKMKYVVFRGSAHFMLRLVDGKYKVQVTKKNHFTDHVFNLLMITILREANKVSADTEAGTLAST